MSGSVTPVQEFGQRTSTTMDTLWRFAALQVAAELGLPERLTESRTARELASDRVDAAMLAAVLDVLVEDALLVREGERYHLSEGWAAARRALDDRGRLSDLRTMFAQVTELIHFASRGELEPGWRATTGELVMEQYRLSRAVTRQFAQQVIPKFPELDARLRAPGAAGLDVGAGGGAVCIGMCEVYPELHMTGLEPAPIPVELARRNVREAALDDRITLQQQGAEALSDRSRYDFAYIAHMFIPDEPLAEALPRLQRALRPGGWLMTAATDERKLASAVLSLRHRARGAVRSSRELARQLENAGFSDVKVHPGVAGDMDGVSARG